MNWKSGGERNVKQNDVRLVVSNPAGRWQHLLARLLSQHPFSSKLPYREFSLSPHTHNSILNTGEAIES